MLQLNTKSTRVAYGHSVTNLSYGDPLAHVWLWEKALLLVPVWGFVVIPLVGYFCRGLGAQAAELGLGATLCLFAIYFCEDLLKRRIRLDDNYIYFGFRTVAIKDLVSANIKYNTSKFLPAALLLTQENGKVLKLSLNGLSDESMDSLLKHLQTRNAAVKIAPVLTSMVKCRRVLPTSLETADRLEIPYKSRQVIGESIDTFKLTARSWIRVGPFLACIAFLPLWLGWVARLFVCLQPNSRFQFANLKMTQFLLIVYNTFGRLLSTESSKAADSFVHSANNYFIAYSVTAIVFFVFCYFLRLSWKPNLLIADRVGIKLVSRVGNISLPLSAVCWSEIKSMGFVPGEGKAGTLKIEKANAEKLSLDLVAIAPEDRARLLRRVEISAPDCQIEHRLSQSMLPSSGHSYTEIWLQSLTQSPERKTLEPLEPGQIVGENRFEVLRSLGVGGQGTAYTCRKSLDKNSESVVLKETILPVFVDAVVRRKAFEAFEREAKLLQSLDHPGIVKLIDHFVEDHRAYLVLEHIKGRNLREIVLGSGALVEEQTRGLAVQMCEILAYLHENSVVHRDFTPDNLVLDSTGKLKLLDFNVAQQIQAGSTGTIVGKHAYLPPEQFRGKATAQSDIYAFGATLYFLLIGNDPEPISQSSPTARNSHVSPSMNQIVKKATALDASNRYTTAQEIKSDLNASEEEQSG